MSAKISSATPNREEIIKRWTDGKFCLVKGYYKGRGPNPEDLDHHILGKIYHGLKMEATDHAAKQFVELVRRLESLSAESFIAAFIKFWTNGFSVNKVFRAQGGKFLFTDDGVTLPPETVRKLSEKIRNEFILDREWEQTQQQQAQSQVAAFTDSKV